MKAIILHEAGGAENLRLAEIDKPVVKDDEVLVKTTSISINPVDLKARAYDGVLNWLFGDERPVILGWDISGEAVEVGKGVTDFKVGTRYSEWLIFLVAGKPMRNMRSRLRVIWRGSPKMSRINRRRRPPWRLLRLIRL